MSATVCENFTSELLLLWLKIIAHVCITFSLRDCEGMFYLKKQETFYIQYCKTVPMLARDLRLRFTAPCRKKIFRIQNFSLSESPRRRDPNFVTNLTFELKITSQAKIIAIELSYGLCREPWPMGVFLNVWKPPFRCPRMIMIPFF